MMAPQKPLVYVVDDDSAIRETLSSLLRSVGLGVRGFASAGEFLAHERPDAPSCIVLDVRLPGQGGLEFQRQLSVNGDPIPIIFISGHGDIPMSVRAIKAGALEFLTKPFRDQDLLDAIQTAINRDAARRESACVTNALRLRYQTLSPREREVLTFLLTGQQSRQIAAAIGASESTVKVHRMQVMRKMEASSLVDLVRMAHRLDLLPGAGMSVANAAPAGVTPT
jgi:FixJ family two-component response regulator